MREINPELIATEVDTIVERNNLDLTDERTEPLPPAAFSAALKDAMLTANQESVGLTQRDIALQALVSRLNLVTGDDTFDPERVQRKLNRIHFDKRRKPACPIGRQTL